MDVRNRGFPPPPVDLEGRHCPQQSSHQGLQQEGRLVCLQRGRRGFGFTLSGQGPCVLSNVVIGSPAHEIGLRAGDRLIVINGVNVSGSQHDDVVDLIARSLQLTMEIESPPASSSMVPSMLAQHSKRRLMSPIDRRIDGAAAAAVSDDEEYMLPPPMTRELPPPVHARGNSADSTLTESSAVAAFAAAATRRPKRPSPRKKANVKARPASAGLAAMPRKPPKRVMNLGGGDELQLMTDREVSSFLHPTLNELRNSIKARNSSNIDLKATRILLGHGLYTYGPGSPSYEERLQQLGLETLESRTIKRLETMALKCENEERFAHYFNPHLDSALQRRKPCFYDIPTAKTDRRHNSPFLFMLRYLNSRPDTPQTRLPQQEVPEETDEPAHMIRDFVSMF